MIVISLTDCPMKLRGYLTKYLCEISTGVYVGKTSAKVRDALWDRVCDTCAHGRAVMVIKIWMALNLCSISQLGMILKLNRIQV